MVVKSFGLHPEFSVFIPDFYESDTSEVVYKEDSHSASLQCSRHEAFFELDHDKWFAYDDGQIIRFPKEREWEWRCNKAKSMVISLNNHTPFNGPEHKLKVLENAAYLCGFSLIDLIDRLESARQENESLSDVFKRVHKDKKPVNNQDNK